MTPNKTIRKLGLPLSRALLQLKRFDAEEGIVIFGEPRSGSTWLMELLMHLPGTLVNWEPLHHSRGVVPPEFNWGRRPLLPVSDDNPDHYTLVRDILSFRRATDWTLERASPRRIAAANIVLTKFVRANLLAPYIISNFAFANKPLFLLRHPVDSCVSQMSAFDDHPDISQFQIPQCINNERYLEQIDFLRQLDDALSFQVAIWCLNNMETLNYPDFFSGVTPVFYEDLLRDPEAVMRGVLEGLSRNCDVEQVIGSMTFRTASKTDFDGQLKRDPIEQSLKNLSRLDDKTRASVQQVFDHFDFSLYDAYSPDPKYARLQSL